MPIFFYISFILPIMADHECVKCGEEAIRHDPEIDAWLCNAHSKERFRERHG